MKKITRQSLDAGRIDIADKGEGGGGGGGLGTYQIQEFGG